MSETTISAQTVAEGEQWRPVIGWEEMFEVSNYGRVRSLRHAARNGGFKRLEAKLLKPTVVCGYRRVSLSRPEGTMRVDRLVLLAFAGPPNRTEVDHEDGNSLNDRLDNLQWTMDGVKVRGGDHADNPTPDLAAIRTEVAP